MTTHTLNDAASAQLSGLIKLGFGVTACYSGRCGTVFEVRDVPEQFLTPPMPPAVTENKGGKTRTVYPFKYHGSTVLWCPESAPTITANAV